jgi:chromosome segregation ATPase
MAKKDDVFDSFLADVLNVIPEEKRSAVKEVIETDTVKSKLREGVLARSEFSQQMDALKRERDSFSAEVTEARTRIDGWKQWYGDTAREVSGIQEKLTKYQEKFGDLESTVQHRQQPVGITAEEFKRQFDQEVQKRDAANLKFADDLTDIKIDYKDRFKEKLPTDKVYSIAAERGLDLNTAYNLFIADRVEEDRQTKWAAELAKAKEEGAAEALSKHNLPVMNSDSSVVHVLDVKNAPSNPRDRVAAAVDAFRKNHR